MAIPTSERFANARGIAASLLWTIIIIVLSTPLAAQEPLLGQRIGSGIDSVERVYFNLFPSIDDFLSATAAVSGDSVLFTIVRSGGRGDMPLLIPGAVAADLRRYVDHYERLFQGDTLRLDWSGLHEIARPSKPFQDNPIVLKVTMRNGGEHTGPLLFSNDSVLVIGTWNRAASFPEIDTTAHVLLVRNIGRIEDSFSTVMRFVNAVYVPIQGNDTMFRLEAWPRIKDRMRYPMVPSPELRRRIADVLRQPRSAVPPPASVAEIEAGVEQQDLHLRLDYGVASEKLNVFYPVGEKPNAAWNRIAVPSQGYFRIALEYDLMNRLRTGVGYTFHDVPLVSLDTFRRFERFTGDEASASLSFTIIPRGGWLQDPWTRFELSVEGGVAVRWSKVDARLSYPSPLQTAPYGKYAESHQTLVGGAISASLDYYFSDYFSLGFGARMTMLPKVDVPRQELYNPRYGYLILVFPEHSFSVNSTDAVIGLCVHY